MTAGLVPTQSGLSRLAAVEADTVRDRLSQVLAATPAYTVVHCCATAVPFGIIQRPGRTGSPSTSASYGGGKRTGWPRRPRRGWGC